MRRSQQRKADDQQAYRKVADLVVAWHNESAGLEGPSILRLAVHKRLAVVGSEPV